jgi:hypothetical protein
MIVGHARVSTDGHHSKLRSRLLALSECLLRRSQGPRQIDASYSEL